MSFVPLHGECAAEIHRLQADLARARNEGYEAARDQAAKIAAECIPAADSEQWIRCQMAIEKGIRAMRPEKPDA